MQFPLENAGLFQSHKTSTAACPLLEMQWDFPVSPAKLFEAFKTKEAIREWWWPNGLHADKVDYDFREGGRYFISMKGTNAGAGMTGRFEEISAGQRIVMTDQFADANGQPISAAEAKMPGEWPGIGYITFEFVAKGADGSRLLLSQEGIPAEQHKDCKQGWSEMFDKLGAFVARRLH